MELSQTDLEKYKQLETAASDYCQHLEEASTGETPLQFLSAVQSHLLHLYTLGRKLPETECADGDYEDHLTNENLRQISENICKRAPFDMYNVFLETFEIDNAEHALGSLSDDLGDIYRDLKNFLLLNASSDADARQHACWEVRFYFNVHWADHCMNAMKAIHDFQSMDGGGW